MRKRSLDCDGNGDGFLRLENVKVPDTTKSRVEPGLSLEACKEECLKNCSCTAYASFNLSGDGGCLMWDGYLVDLRVKSDGGHDIYIRVAASELEKEEGQSPQDKEKKKYNQKKTTRKANPETRRTQNNRKKS